MDHLLVPRATRIFVDERAAVTVLHTVITALITVCKKVLEISPRRSAMAEKRKKSTGCPQIPNGNTSPRTNGSKSLWG
ncbi:MAG TPA: hypothetical protein VF427_09485 [Noviherbaspirillum sp.]